MTPCQFHSLSIIFIHGGDGGSKQGDGGVGGGGDGGGGRRRLRRTYLERLKWTHHIKHDAIHRKVMKTLRRFIEEDDMDFDEAAESAVAKRKFLLNRLMKKKLLPDADDEEEVAEGEV